MPEFIRNPFVIGGALVAVIAAFIIWAVVQDSKALAEWSAWCESQGGRVDKVSKTSTGTGVSTDGKPVVTTSTETTYYCLTPEGGLLDVR